MMTTISSGRGASATASVSVSKWSNDQLLSLCPRGTSIDAPAVSSRTTSSSVGAGSG
jgi:hypothetical protein